MEDKSFEEWINLDGVESERTYHMPSGREYTIVDPVKLFVKASGSHKLIDKTGKMWYIKSDWEIFSAKGKWEFNIT